MWLWFQIWTKILADQQIWWKKGTDWWIGIPLYKHQEFPASGFWAMHYGICTPEKWAPTLESPPLLNIRFSFAFVYLLFMVCFSTGILTLRLLYWSAILQTGESINFLAAYVFRKKKCDKTLWVSRGMFTCEMFQVCNHSVLISSLGMGFGHRNFVVVGCPNSGKRLNKWEKPTCTVHVWTGHVPATASHHSSFFPFPTKKKDSEGRRR